MWKQGALKVGGKLRPVWKYILPPWTQSKPITMLTPPKGAKNVGMRTPAETVQMIGVSKAKVPETISIDLGVADIYVTDHGRSIKFVGGGLETNIGKRIESPTKGMSIPKDVAPARLREYEEEGAAPARMREYEEEELGMKEEYEPEVRKSGRLIPVETLPEVMRVFG